MKCISACSQLSKTLTVILSEVTSLLLSFLFFKKRNIICFQEMCKHSLCSCLTVADLLIAENVHDYFIYVTYLYLLVWSVAILIKNYSLPSYACVWKGLPFYAVFISMPVDVYYEILIFKSQIYSIWTRLSLSFSVYGCI
jgi:hypothetical protein